MNEDQASEENNGMLPVYEYCFNVPAWTPKMHEAFHDKRTIGESFESIKKQALSEFGVSEV